MEIIDRLKRQAAEIADEGHPGWGNTILDAAIALTDLTAQKAPVADFQCSDGLSCPTMEDCQYVQWLADDKNILSAALREIYNIRGEDEELAKIINEALDRGSAT